MRTLVRAALAAACLAGATVSVITYVSEIRLQHGAAALARGHNAEGALRELRASDSPLNPNSQRSVLVAVALFRAGRRSEAERTLVVAARREPENVQIWASLAYLEFRLGHLAAARAAFAHARQLEPQPHLPLPSF